MLFRSTFGALGALFGGLTPIFWILAVIMGGSAWFAASRDKAPA